MIKKANESLTFLERTANTLIFKAFSPASVSPLPSSSYYQSGLSNDPKRLINGNSSLCTAVDTNGPHCASCLVAERCWDRVRYAIEEYTWRFDGLRRRASHRRRT
ncbi:hypothetical protein FS320_19985 [Microvirga tunisiensis]|uniref:Uncharacterized protein n=1 Tax=Microvirga tunisiensis TaxID=2108360 RepID=A0A5N7ML87_9HYPH|nr:hypothetical protein [Microvirga tunisiensis]MPR27410.1 hypothetical protein [Microvirga tunisiensis]